MFLCCGEQAFAGAWNQRGGEGQVISTSSWSQGDQIFDDDFKAVPLRGFSKTETRLYLEHGITDSLTLVGNGGFQGLNFQDSDSRFEFEGLDDIEIGLQVNTHSKEGFASAIRFTYVRDSRLDNRVVDVLGGGDQAELRGLIGQSRETLMGDVFYDAQLAVRTEDFAKLNEVQTALTVGYKPTGRWLAMIQSYANFAEGDLVDGFIVPEQAQISVNFSLARQYKPGRYIQIGTGRTVIGRNIVQERGLFIGIWTEY